VRGASGVSARRGDGRVVMPGGQARRRGERVGETCAAGVSARRVVNAWSGVRSEARRSRREGERAMSASKGASRCMRLVGFDRRAPCDMWHQGNITLHNTDRK
jgi:hypothetical protein